MLGENVLWEALYTLGGLPLNGISYKVNIQQINWNKFIYSASIFYCFDYIYFKILGYKTVALQGIVAQHTYHQSSVFPHSQLPKISTIVFKSLKTIFLLFFFFFGKFISSLDFTWVKLLVIVLLLFAYFSKFNHLQFHPAKKDLVIFN